MRLLVCGGRKFWDANLLNQILNDIHKEERITLIIHGLASGADTLAVAWAERNNVPVEGYRAEWKKYAIPGRKNPAGVIRNTKMLVEGKPDKVVAFPGGEGTADMVRKTIVAKIPYMIIEKRGV